MARTKKVELIDVVCACCGYQGRTAPRDGVVVAARTRTRQCAAMPDVWICTVCMTKIENKRNLVVLATTELSREKVEIV